MSERATSYDEDNDTDRVAGLTSQPAVYQDPDDPEYPKDFPDPDAGVHTIVPGSVTPPAVAESGADLGTAQPAPLTDYPVAVGDVPGHSAAPTVVDTDHAVATPDESAGEQAAPAQEDLGPGETPVEPSTPGEPAGALNPEVDR